MQACPIKVASRAAKGFVAAVCIIIIILEAWTSWHERTAEMEESFRATANMALALSSTPTRHWMKSTSSSRP